MRLSLEQHKIEIDENRHHWEISGVQPPVTMT